MYWHIFTAHLETDKKMKLLIWFISYNCTEKQSEIFPSAGCSLETLYYKTHNGSDRDFLIVLRRIISTCLLDGQDYKLIWDLLVRYNYNNSKSLQGCIFNFAQDNVLWLYWVPVCGGRMNVEKFTFLSVLCQISLCSCCSVTYTMHQRKDTEKLSPLIGKMSVGLFISHKPQHFKKFLFWKMWGHWHTINKCTGMPDFVKLQKLILKCWIITTVVENN